MSEKKEIVFITGSASGIGKQIGETFLKEGKTVVFSDINEEALSKVVSNFQNDGLDAFGPVCDVTNAEDINNTIDKIIDKYGHLDILVNNAGMQHVSMIEDFPYEKFDFMIKAMLTAPFVAIKRAFPHMKNQKHGRIINMASINGVIGFAGKAAYNSAKHGVMGLTKVSALEGAEYGITVNAVCPGYVDTPLVRGQFQDLANTRNIPLEKVLDQVLYPLVPQKRLIDVHEIADYVSFLASDKAKGITGQACIIDGGYTAQ